MRFVAHVASGNPHRNPGPHRTLQNLIELADRGTPRAIRSKSGRRAQS
jgi:hypothetical protein